MPLPTVEFNSSFKHEMNMNNLLKITGSIKRISNWFRLINCNLYMIFIYDEQKSDIAWKFTGLLFIIE